MDEIVNYVLLDAARIEWQMPLVIRKNEHHKTLYAGRPEEDLAGISPYLFSCKSNADFRNVLWREAKGNSWGVFVETKASFDELFEHFGKFVRVETEHGRELYFRFYDPRVLHIYLPTCTPEELKSFFGPVESFLAENETADELTRYTVQNGILHTELIPDSRIFDLSTPDSLFEYGEDLEEPEKQEELAADKNVETPDKGSPSRKWDF